MKIDFILHFWRSRKKIYPLFFARDRSFTLTETLIAVSIIVIALVAIIILAFYSYSIGIQSGEIIVAIGLSREGMEIIRAIRDSNWLVLRPWSDSLVAGTYIANNDSTVLTSTNPPKTTIQNCTNCGLCLSGVQYFHCQEPTTPYQRMLRITDDGVDKKIISSEVFWSTKIGTRMIKLEQILTNWR